MKKIVIFDTKYRSLSGVLGAEFYDGYFDSDDEMARRIFGPPGGPHAAELRNSMEALVDDCHEALKNMDEMWEPLAHRANKEFSGPKDAHEWLSRMTAIWENWLVEQEKVKKGES